MAVSLDISNGKYQVIVSENDISILSSFRWRKNSAGYAMTTLKDNKLINMHVFLLGKKDGFQIDHINGNRLDNRRDNLRYVTHKQNQLNKRTSSTTSVTGIKGVGWCKQTSKWRVSMRINDGSTSLGRYSCIGQAIKAYNQAAIIHHGEYARLNRST